MAKKKEEAAPEAPSRAELETLATEMNDVMGLDPKIKFNRKTSDDDLLGMIMDNANDPETGETCIYASDFEEDEDDPEKAVFSEEAEATIVALGIEIGEDGEPEEEVVKPAAKGAKADKKAVEKEEPKKAAQAAKGKKAKEEEPEEEPAPKKGAKAALAKEEKKAPAKADKKADKPKAAKKEKEKKYGRADSIADAIAAAKKSKKGITFDALNESSCDLYDEENNEETPRPYSNSWLRAVLTILVAIDAAELKSDKYTFN